MCYQQQWVPSLQTYVNTATTQICGNPGFEYTISK